MQTEVAACVTLVCALALSETVARLAHLALLSFVDPQLMMHSAMPPMRGMIGLPQPLRWFMGRWTTEMNQRLKQWPPQDGSRAMSLLRLQVRSLPEVGTAAMIKKTRHIFPITSKITRTSTIKPSPPLGA